MNTVVIVFVFVAISYWLKSSVMDELVSSARIVARGIDKLTETNAAIADISRKLDNVNSSLIAIASTVNRMGELDEVSTLRQRVDDAVRLEEALFTKLSYIHQSLDEFRCESKIINRD